MSFLEKLKIILFPLPQNCPICGRKQNKSIVCSECLRELAKYKVIAGQCQRCGTFGVYGNICNNCRTWPLYLKANFALMPYEGIYRKALHEFKFKKQGWIGEALIDILFKDFQQTEIDLIIPVPLHEKRQLERGFNQSAFLAQLIAEKMNTKISEKVLIRIKDTPHQTGLTRECRRKNLKKSFAVISEEIKNKKVLLVDDVITTGATLLECARILKKAGASSITCVTLAAGIL